ncbi:MAG: transposase [Gemmatimonadetes bacterium]|nr:transposase [Gemmatimonadota bacterium]
MLIRREGWAINHKKTHRLYKAEGLQLKPRRPRRRRAVLQRVGGTVVTALKQCWAMDFMHDTLADGRTIRIFSTEFTSQALDHWAYWNHVQPDFSRPGKPVDNCACEAFNGSLRRECLSRH